MTTIGVTGHQVLPLEAVSYIEREIARIVEEIGSRGDLVGLTSLAIGADQLFAKAIIFAGGQLEVIVPCREYETTFNREEDLIAYRLLLARSSKVEIMDYDNPSEESFFAAGCRIVDSCDELLAIWDGKPARGFGGTADIVKYARGDARRITVIWPKGVVR